MVDTGTIVWGVGMFTAIVMALAGLILVARSKLVSTADVKIEINDDPSRALTVEAGGKLLQTLAQLARIKFSRISMRSGNFGRRSSPNSPT